MSNPAHTQRQTAYLQALYLQAMDIQTWVRKTTVPTDALEAKPVAGRADIPAVETPPLPIEAPPAASREVSGETAIETASAIAPDALEFEMSQPAGDVSRLDWPQLRSAVASCTACVLHESRTQTVFGVGDQQAQWLVIGEAPGVDEDSQGEPFVGRAGKLLNNMLQAVGLKREQAYIANILKCRPPDNRDPRPEEIAQCEGYLQQQVALIQPKVILAVGRVAAHNLLKSNETLGNMRGSLHRYGNIPVVVTYHPAYLLRKPRDKGKAWDDLRLALKVVNGELRQ